MSEKIVPYLTFYEDFDTIGSTKQKTAAAWLGFLDRPDRNHLKMTKEAS